MTSRKASLPPATAGDVIVKFRAFDLNTDGVIDRRELGKVLHELNAEFWNSRRVNRMLTIMDLNNDQLVQYEEFVRWTFAEPPSERLAREHEAFTSALHKLSPPLAAPQKSSSKDELQEALESFFSVHATRLTLDLEIFIEAQTALADSIGDTANRLASVEAFMNVSSKPDPPAQLEAFSSWQLGVLEAKGLRRSRCIEALRQSTEKMRRSSRRKSCLDAERARRMAPSHPTVSRRTSQESAEPTAPTRPIEQPPELSRGVGRHVGEPPPIDEARGIQEVLEAAASRTESKPASPTRRQPVETKVASTRRQPVELGRLQDLGNSIADSDPFSSLTRRGRECPEEHASSVPELVKYLVEGTASDDQRAWVIYSWVCHHIEYDVDGLHGRAARQSCKPDDVLVNRKSVCAGYASIYESLAAAAGLNVKTIGGHARNISRSVGQDVLGQDVGGHAWSSVKLGDEWILIDSTWGAGNTSDTKFKFEFKPYFFGVPPREFIFTHFPKDPKMQMLHPPVSYSDFINAPIMSCNEFFSCYELEFVPDFHRSGFIQPGQPIQLRVPPDVSLKLSEGFSEARGDDNIVRISYDGTGASALQIMATRPGVNKTEKRGGRTTTWYYYACEFSASS